MVKKVNKNIINQINKLKHIARFGITKWEESATAAVKIFFSGKKTVSFLSVGVLKEYDIITAKLYNQNKIIQNNFTLQNFIDEIVNLLSDLHKENRDASNDDWNSLINQMIEKPDIKTEIAVPIYGILLNSPFVELGDFKIYKKETLKNKYAKSTTPGAATYQTDFYLAKVVVAKSLDKCREDAETSFFKFESIANFITAGFHKTYKISLYNSWFSSQVQHFAFTENYILTGGKTLHRFDPVKIENTYFFDQINGYGEVWKMITSKNNNLQTKILESIEWSGKASVETDDNKAFLLYIIAIESILNFSHPNTLHAPITVSLADSVAFLLGKSKQARIQYAETLTKLYGIRSGIVHGSVRKISELDLHTAFSLSHQIIKKILFEEPYKSFESKEKLTAYLLKEKKYEMGEK